MSTLRYASDPLASGAWQVSSWDAGQSRLLRWSPDNLAWNASSGTLDVTLSPSPAGAPRPYQSGEIQSVQSASTGTWGWTAEVPDLVSGSVFGLFTYRADHFRDPWIEFDFEFLGIDAGKRLDPASGQILQDPDGDIDGDGDVDIHMVRLNIHMETRRQGHVTLEEAKGGPVLVALPFDATEGQHSYAVTVTASEAVFTVDGAVVATFGAKDMPGGVWTSGAMKSFVNLWNVDPDLESWAGTWTDPGRPLVAQLSGATYAPLGGTATLIGGAAPAPVLTIERQGTPGNDRLIDIAGTSTDFRGEGGDDRFCFLAQTRGGAAERDVIWDFAPHGDAAAQNDTVEVSKAAAGVKGFSTLYRNISDVGGDAVLRFADGSTLTFEGLLKADLGYADFVLV